MRVWAYAEEDIDSRMINKETNGASPWDVQASSPIAGAINGGDVIMLPRVANASFGENKSNVSIHLATAAQVIDLGPVLVFNFGNG